jgi:hypothetical protein
VYFYGEYIGSSTSADDHLRVLITARFTAGEILSSYGMLRCAVNDEIYDDDGDDET